MDRLADPFAVLALLRAALLAGLLLLLLWDTWQYHWVPRVPRFKCPPAAVTPTRT